MEALRPEGRQKKIVIIGGIALGLIGGGVFIGAKTLDARETAAREEKWGALQACLIGNDALKDGETASARVATIKLGYVGVPLDKRGVKAGESGWPANCSAAAYQLSEHAQGTPLGEATEALAKALKADGAATADLHAEIDKVWAEAKTAQLKGAAPADSPRAPKVALPLYTPDQFKGLPKFLSGTFSLANVHEQTAPGSKLYFLIDQKDTSEGPVICAANATDPEIKCQKVPQAVATLSPGIRLIGTTDDMARPFYFAGDRGQLGVFPSDGKSAITAGINAYGASVHADGSIGMLARKEGSKELHFIHQAVSGPGADQTVLQNTDFDAFTQTGMFWDWIVWRSMAKKDAPSHFFARKADGSAVKPQVDVGELQEASENKAERDREQVFGCKSDEAIAVRVSGMKGDDVAFFAGGRWSAPVKSTTRGGAFTCHGIETVSTVVTHSSDRDKDYPTISQTKCNTSGCTTTKVDVRTLFAGLEIAPTDTGNSIAADVGGKLLFLWNAGNVGGLRMRYAPADRFKDAEDVIITDGREDKAGANVSSIAAMRAISTNNYALVFLATTAGVKVVRVDPTGKLTPLVGTL